MIKKSLFGTFYFVSFFISPMVLLFDWIYYLGDYVCAGIVTALILYDLAYIFFLRKRENKGLGRSIAQGFLYTLLSINIAQIINFVDSFINGFQVSTVVGHPIGERYYGFEAIINDRVSIFVFGITFTVFAVYCVGYLIISMAIRK